MFYREASRSDSEVDNARWYDPGISHFTQPDTIVPDSYNPLDWNRYSYVRYNPLKYTDPTGHDPRIWNPFDFNTLILQVALNIELPYGINVNLVELALDITAFKEYEFNVYDIKFPKPDFAVNISATGTAGLQAEGAALGTFYGTNESVDEIINNNVSTLLTEPTLPAHLVVCWEYCFGAGYNIDPADPSWSAGESISYSFGFGYGVSAGLDIAEARDWVVHYSPNTGWRTQKPTRFKEYFREAADEFFEIIPY